jgi:hypothetical protein
VAANALSCLPSPERKSLVAPKILLVPGKRNPEKIESGKSAADEPFTPKNGVYSGQQLASRICLDHVAACPQAEGFLYHIGGTFLANEEYFRGGAERAYSPGGFDSIQLRKSDVQQNQVRLQFLCLLNRFESVRDLTYDLQSGLSLKYLRDKTPQRCEIVYHENPD